MEARTILDLVTDETCNYGNYGTLLFAVSGKGIACGLNHNPHELLYTHTYLDCTNGKSVTQSS